MEIDKTKFETIFGPDIEVTLYFGYRFPQHKKKISMIVNEKDIPLIKKILYPNGTK